MVSGSIKRIAAALVILDVIPHVRALTLELSSDDIESVQPTISKSNEKIKQADDVEKGSVQQTNISNSKKFKARSFRRRLSTISPLAGQLQKSIPLEGIFIGWYAWLLSWRNLKSKHQNRASNSLSLLITIINKLATVNLKTFNYFRFHIIF